MGHSIPAGFQHYDISRDGKRFLMIKEEELPEAEGQINVALNWFKKLNAWCLPTDTRSSDYFNFQFRIFSRPPFFPLCLWEVGVVAASRPGRGG